MAAIRAAAIALACVLAVSGCAARQPLPQGPTVDEVTAILDRQHEQWWNSMFPDEPMPEVEPIEFLNVLKPSTVVSDCILAAGLDGVRPTGQGISFGAMEAAEEARFNRVQFECSLRYPYDPARPDLLGIFSVDQLEYLYTDFTKRLVPCLTLQGYRVAVVPPYRTFVRDAPYLTWEPYFAIVPQPTTPQQWQRIDFVCPPPAIGFFWRPGIDYSAEQ